MKAACLLVAILALYAVVYYSLVVDTIQQQLQNGGILLKKEPEYRLKYKAVKSILTPMHLVDKKIRPEVWASEEQPFYLTDDVQYIEAGPEFKLANEAATKRAEEEERKLKSNISLQEILD